MQRQCRINECMDEMAGRVGLHRDLQRFPFRAEPSRKASEVALRLERAEVAAVEAEASFVRRPRCDEVVLGKRCGGDAAHCRPARMQALGPGAVGEELEAAGGDGQGDALSARKSLGIQTMELACRDRAGKRADRARGMEADLVEGAFCGRGDACAGFHAGDVCSEEVASVQVALRRDAQCRRQHRYREMDDAFGMGVVVIQAVHEDAVDKRRVAQRQPLGLADHCARAAGAQLRGGAQRSGREVEAARGESAADRVEDQVLGTRSHLGRDAVPGEGRRKRAERGGGSHRAALYNCPDK
jgi:hypothetical protein